MSITQTSYPGTQADGGCALIQSLTLFLHNRRECDVDVEELPEARGGGVDISALSQSLVQYSGEGRTMIIGSFSAASNITGAGPIVHRAVIHRPIDSIPMEHTSVAGKQSCAGVMDDHAYTR